MSGTVGGIVVITKVYLIDRFAVYRNLQFNVVIALRDFRHDIDAGSLKRKLKTRIRLIRKVGVHAIRAKIAVSVIAEVIPCYRAVGVVDNRSVRFLDQIILSACLGLKRKASPVHRILIITAYPLKRTVAELLIHSLVFPSGSAVLKDLTIVTLVRDYFYLL